MNDHVRLIKERLDIVDVVSAYLPLRKRGKHYVALCPFHSEKTPSFTVSQERQTYHCFGCGKGGDIFSFVMAMENLSFPEALEKLAQMAGVQVDKRVSSRLPILEEALRFFRDRLNSKEGAAAQGYLSRRGLDPRAFELFELGWAPMSWGALRDHLASRGFSVKDALDAGLLVEGQRGPYDRFRGRVIFPLRNETGRLVGFGGRLVDGEGAKYVNSPEGPLFEKRKFLYLLNMAKQAIRERGRVILVEGYMDAIRCHLKGFNETVACLGTSLTEEQCAMIARHSDRCAVCFDSDLAGQEAAVRGMYMLHRMGVEVAVVRIPSGKDPDELLSAPDGVSKFKAALESALPLPVFHAASRVGSGALGMDLKGQRELLEGLASLSPLYLKEHIPKVAEVLGVLPHQLERELDRVGRGRGGSLGPAAVGEPPGRASGNGSSAGVPGDSPQEDKDDLWEWGLCAALWYRRELRGVLPPERVIPLLRRDEARTLAFALLCGEDPGEMESRWAVMGDRVYPAIIAKGGAFLDQLMVDDPVGEILAGLERNHQMRRYRYLKERMARGESLENHEMEEFFNLARKIKGRG
ncbi:MAG: DNA primase [Thermanaerothrix sp.]|nr:DNA primase [Thermanaerothrix sp.]